MSVSDDFNRADSANLGANWTQIVAALQIVSNEVRGTNNGVYQFSTYTGVSWNADHSSQIVLKFLIDDMGVLVRFGSGPQGYMGMANSSGGGLLRIYRVDPGPSFTQLGTYSGTVAVDDVIKLDISGTNLTLYQNGVSRVTATDSTYSTGAPGIYLSQGSTGGRLDDWVGTGDVVAGAPPVGAFCVNTNRLIRGV